MPQPSTAPTRIASLGDWLRRGRASARISQDALAARLREYGGCNQHNISVWELGRAIPDAGQLVALTRALGIEDPADLALRDELAIRARRDLHARRHAAA